MNLVKLELRKMFKNYFFIGLIIIFNIFTVITLVFEPTEDLKLERELVGEYTVEKLDYAQSIYDELSNKVELKEDEVYINQFEYNDKIYTYAKVYSNSANEDIQIMNQVSKYIESFYYDVLESKHEGESDSNSSYGEPRPQKVQYDRLIKSALFFASSPMMLTSLLFIIAASMYFTSDNNNKVDIILRASKKGKKYLYIKYIAILIGTVLYVSGVFIVTLLITHIKYGLFNMLGQVEYYAFGRFYSGIGMCFGMYIFVIIYVLMGVLLFASISKYLSKSVIPVVIFFIIYFAFPMFVQSLGLYSSYQGSLELISLSNFIKLSSPLGIANSRILTPSRDVFQYYDVANRIDYYYISLVGFEIDASNFEFFVLGFKTIIVSIITILSSIFYLKKYEKGA